MANEHFKFFRENEFNLYSGLVKEMIEIHGVDAVYLPYNSRKMDYLFGEDILTQYKERFNITVYVQNVDGWQGPGDLYAKFGITQPSEMTFWIQKDKFTEYTGLPRPMAGDLLYLPWAKEHNLQEITSADPETSFYHSGDWVTWEIRTTRMEYSKEDVRMTDDDPYSPQLDDINSNDDNFSDNVDLISEFETGIADFNENDIFGEH